MDIYRQSEVILQRAGYRTRFTTTGSGDVLGFEDDVAIGFLHVFTNPEALVTQWQAVQKADFSRHAVPLRSSPNKAWNVYCVFLTGHMASGDVAEQIDRIEEDLISTRKIARGGVVSLVDLERALLPLLPVQTLADLSVTDYDSRLRPRLAFIPRSVAESILGGDEAAEIARQAIKGP